MILPGDPWAPGWVPWGNHNPNDNYMSWAPFVDWFYSTSAPPDLICPTLSKCLWWGRWICRNGVRGERMDCSPWRVDNGSKATRETGIGNNSASSSSAFSCLQVIPACSWWKLLSVHWDWYLRTFPLTDHCEQTAVEAEAYSVHYIAQQWENVTVYGGNSETFISSFTGMWNWQGWLFAQEFKTFSV